MRGAVGLICCGLSAALIWPGAAGARHHRGRIHPPRGQVHRHRHRGGHPPARLTTPVVDVSGTLGEAEGEEYPALNPANPRDIIVGSNQWQPMSLSGTQDFVGLGPSGFTRCAVWSSHDGGSSWSGGPILDTGLGPVSSPFQIPPVPGEFNDPGNVYSADQNTVFDRQGTAWYTCLNFGVTTGVEVIDVWRSQDGGRTWGKPVPAFSQLTDSGRQMDRPWLAVDQSGGPRDGTLYLVYENIFYDPLDPGVYLRSSTDGGRHWGPVTRVDTPAFPGMQDARDYLAVGADGTVYVMYDSGALHTEYDWAPQVQKPSIVLATSTDGGRTFAHRWIARNVDEPTPPDEDEVELTEFIPSMAADPGRPGHLAIGWEAMVDNTSRELLISSVNGGRTWTAPLDVADDPTSACPPSRCPPVSTLGYQFPPGQGNQHDHVEVRYLPDGSLVDVWRDRRFTGGSWTDPWDIFARRIAVGPDGRLTPGTTVRVTPQSETPTSGHRGHMPSEYLGVAVGSRGIGVSWDAMHGLYPDDFYRFITLSAFGTASQGLSQAPGSEPNGGACQLAATLALTPAPTSVGRPLRYSLDGSLSNCHAGTAAGPDGAARGSIFTPEPASGQGGCSDGTARGTAVVKWADGRTTVVPFATVTDGAGLHFTGYVAYSHAGYTTDEPATPINDSVEGGGTFSCHPGARTAMLNGLIGFGSPF